MSNTVKIDIRGLTARGYKNRTASPTAEKFAELQNSSGRGRTTILVQLFESVKGEEVINDVVFYEGLTDEVKARNHKRQIAVATRSLPSRVAPETA